MARQESAKLALHRLQKRMRSTDERGNKALVLLIGDLNAEEQPETGYTLLTGSRYYEQGQGSPETFFDTRKQVNAPAITTFTNWTETPVERVIDFVFAGDNGQTRFKPIAHDVHSNIGSAGFRMSDHQLVVTTFEMT